MRSEQEIIEYLNTLLKEQEDFNNEEVSWSDGEQFNCYDPDDVYMRNQIESEEENMNAKIGILQWVLRFELKDEHVQLADMLGRLKDMRIRESFAKHTGTREDRTMINKEV